MMLSCYPQCYGQPGKHKCRVIGQKVSHLINFALLEAVSVVKKKNPPFLPHHPFHSAGLSLMPSSALVELLHRVEAAIREYSEELVGQLARREELEFEKEVKNTFITALIEVQNRQKEQRDSSKRRRRDKALSLQGGVGAVSVNAGNTGTAARVEKTASMPVKVK